MTIPLLAWIAGGPHAGANPIGGTVTQGTAAIGGSGSQVSINQSSTTAFINWRSFNIGAGETTTFNQPSSSSVTWNYIGDTSASSINGTLNANGYVILQNPNGFAVGGSAAINTHGLVMTTAATPNLNLSGGGAWTFDAPPPTAKIVNYGRINIAGGGSAYLIASDIENNGTISAPGGKIGLYAGQQVLVSMSPDGRGLSAQVTLPVGSVDNNGNLIADAGGIAAQAQVVNQNGLIQANSVRNINGTIELVAGDAVNLGANSTISAHGDTQGTSPGGSVMVQAGNSFSDQAGSTINIAGGAQGGNGGQAEISAPTMGAINSSINGQAVDGFVGGELTIDPSDITLDSTYVSSLNNQISGGLSQINLQTSGNIELSTTWTLTGSADPTATVSLSAGSNIKLDDGSSIAAGNNWNVNLTAGNGIYLWGSAFLQTQNGNLDLQAGNEVQVGWNGSETIGVANPGTGAIRTTAGGNIVVTAVSGDVNSGSSVNGFNYLTSAPYFTASPTVGGISTAAGGSVTVNAGGNVTSFSATAVAANPSTSTAGDPDPGSGAFGAAPGNVTINAGGSVYGHFVEVNGVGTIIAGQNIGAAGDNVALSLVGGSWNLNAGWNPITQTVQSGQGDIYLQEVRNPNGLFNTTTTGFGFNKKPSAGNHLFDYDPQASVTLTAGDGVYLTGYDLPRPDGGVPMLLPPTLNINAGPGGVTLQTPIAIDANQNPVVLSDNDITLFPSPYGNLQITTTGGGGFSSGNADGSSAYLLMSDSSYVQWSSSLGSMFGPNDHASVPAELNNDNPVILDISGDMQNVILQVCKLAWITVDGNMNGCTFYGENLRAGDVTSITVGGQIYYASSFTSVTLAQAFPDLLQLSQSLPAGDTYLPPGTVDFWYTMLQLALVNPNEINNQTYSYSENLSAILNSYRVFPGLNLQYLDYNPNTLRLTVTGPLSSPGDSLPSPDTLYNILESGTLYLVRYGPDGKPVLDNNGHFEIDPVTWVSGGSANASLIYNLNTQSQGKPGLVGSGALIVGGTGEFDVTASSINLGNSDGILSVGDGGTPSATILGLNYSFLAPYITSGATIKVTTDYLVMPSSTIAALGGGDVDVTCNGVIPPGSDPNSPGANVSMDLGSPDLLDFEGELMSQSNVGLGIYTSGGGNVNVIGLGTINIDTSRIGTFDGGNVFVESLTGDVNAGNGGTLSIPIMAFPVTAPALAGQRPYEYAYANGIVADTLQPQGDGSLVPGAATQPGNITVLTPQGSIYASLGGILQETLSGDLLPGPTITLDAGTPAGDNSPGYVGNIDLGESGAIGGTVNVHATGKVTGLLIASQNANVTGQSVGSLTVLAAGTANVSAQSGGNDITIIGGQGVNASGLGSGAILLGQNVSVNGGAAQSTLGTSASATATSQSAAGQANAEAQQQVASTDNEEDDQKKKKKPEIRKVGRVTVILSTAVPAR